MARVVELCIDMPLLAQVFPPEIIAVAGNQGIIQIKQCDFQIPEVSMVPESVNESSVRARFIAQAVRFMKKL